MSENSASKDKHGFVTLGCWFRVAVSLSGLYSTLENCDLSSQVLVDMVKTTAIYSVFLVSASVS